MDKVLTTGGVKAGIAWYSVLSTKQPAAQVREASSSRTNRRKLFLAFKHLIDVNILKTVIIIK